MRWFLRTFNSLLAARILMGFRISTIFLPGTNRNPHMGRIGVRWQSFRSNLKIICHPICNWLHVQMYVCVCVCVCVWRPKICSVLDKWSKMFVHVCVIVHMWKNVCTCVCECAYVCAYVNTNMCLYEFMYIYVYTHTRICTNIYAYTRQYRWGGQVAQQNIKFVCACAHVNTNICL